MFQRIKILDIHFRCCGVKKTTETDFDFKIKVDKMQTFYLNTK